ncbi:hypothetical protein B0H14DRAFT_3688181 [Mycena olivaceomarginata]|nr:hypothetical protein B0H14DRAFT_3688181 [Mycena olivaceomarginata]
MAQSTGNKAIPREKSMDPGEQFDLATNSAGEEEEPPRDKGKNRARADSLSSLSDKGDGDGVMLGDLEGAHPRNGAWKAVVDYDTDNDEQGSASRGSKSSRGTHGGFVTVQGGTGAQEKEGGGREKETQEEEARVAKEKSDAKKRKKKEQGAAAAKSHGGQPAVTEAGPAPVQLHPPRKRVRKTPQTPEQLETLEVPSPADADEALVAAEASKRPAKRTRGRKVSFSNPLASTSVTTDTPPGEEESGSPAEVVSPTTGLQGLRVERDKLGRFVMPPERLLEIIQSAAAELAASQAAENMKVLTESGTNHEVGGCVWRIHRIGGAAETSRENKMPKPQSGGGRVAPVGQQSS